MTTIDNHTAEDIKTCIVCGDELMQLTNSIDTVCDYCGEKSISHFRCESSHYICDSCIAVPVNEHIKKICLKYNGNNPMELAVQIMNTPIIRMHGSEHHFILPAVLMTVTYKNMKQPKELDELLDAIERRVLYRVPDNCRFGAGSCGAALGAGIYLEIFDNIPEDESDWNLSNILTAKCMNFIAHNHGPRCCKRDTYLSITAACEFLKDNYLIDFNLTDAKCTFSLRNKSCGREDCTFYNLANSLV